MSRWARVSASNLNRLLDVKSRRRRSRADSMGTEITGVAGLELVSAGKSGFEF
jgi:hypothetical protein